MSKELKSEFEVPPHTKVRVVAVVDSRLKDEMELIHEAECDREVPDWRNTLEMLFRKGVRAYRQNAKKG